MCTGASLGGGLRVADSCTGHGNSLILPEQNILNELFPKGLTQTFYYVLKLRQNQSLCSRLARRHKSILCLLAKRADFLVF